jgi:hypothetical protein
MKEEMNKEMDLLLRRLSRRQDSSMSNGDASIVGEHLDADELSSYAENALPAAARASYTEHLAECARCRELIVQLSSSIGVVAAEQTARVPAPSGLRNFLASLFSPMVLRYAIPALGIIVVAAIGFFSLRQDRRGLVTQHTDAPAARPNGSPVFSLDSQSGKAQQLDNNDKNASPAVETEGARQTKPSHDDVAPPPNAPPMVGLHAEVSKDAAAKKADDLQTAGNAAPAPQPTPAPAVATEEAKKAEAEPPKEVSQRAVSDLPAKEPSTTAGFEKSKRDRAAEVARPGSRPERSTNAERSTREKALSPASGTGTTLQQAEVDRAQRDGVDESDSETRSVAGRRFRKQGNLWIDTGFNSGTSTVNVSRGSEQFRALVADEPEIKTIANQLDGEIIVVWKGRAYRIR